MGQIGQQMIALLDGRAGVGPAFMVIPMPHPDDRADHEESGENWWPDPAEKTVDAVDIAGKLHSLFCRRDRKASEQ